MAPASSIDRSQPRPGGRASRSGLRLAVASFVAVGGFLDWNPESGGDEGQAGALDHDGEEDDDEDDAVDLVALGGPSDDGQGGEQDRHRALEAAPGDKASLTPGQPSGEQQRGHDE